MKCAYHTENPASVHCNGCGKPLCRACDHRIKGFPFCENCIVTGVELLKIRNQTSNADFVKRKVSPFVSALFSVVCPGLGAAYNGQISKALVHFAVFVSLFHLAMVLSNNSCKNDIPSFSLTYYIINYSCKMCYTNK